MVQKVKVKVLSFSKIGGEGAHRPTYLQRKTPLHQTHLQNTQMNRQYISEC